MSFHVPNQYRLTRYSKNPALESDDSYENNGCFIVPFESFKFMIIASDGADWEHVSISLSSRTPNWKEMCFMKNLFWDEEDCVMQFHPPKSEYVNMHDYTLHLWRPLKEKLPLPPSILVGIK